MWLLQCCLLVQALVSRAAYYHELSMTTITPPKPLAKDAFFGYSVAFQNNRPEWMLGAERSALRPAGRPAECPTTYLCGGDSGHQYEFQLFDMHAPLDAPLDARLERLLSLVASAPRADEDGQVFSCDLHTRNCTQMHFTIAGTRVEHACRDDHDIGTCRDVRHTHHFWLGATVKADDRNVFVCAPRFTAKLNVISGTTTMASIFGANGLCFVNDLSSNTNFNKMTQISINDRNRDLTHNENATDAFGWSMDIDVKGSLRVGSPAPAAGRVMTYVNAREEIKPNMVTSPYPNGFNFGYSIATGVFIDNSRHRSVRTKKPGVAIGTPYGEDGTGQVLFYDETMKLQAVVKDPAGVGSIFSAALCAAKLDGLTTSLLVGAPAHFTGKHYHTGVVYVYRQEKRMINSLKIFNVIEGPKKDGAFFGYAIANVGDMDNDGKDEIAIAAPYEDEGRGAVYLYAGSSLSDRKTDITWLQRFQPEDSKFQNVGLSLVADKYFGSGCNELAIGAPGNDRVAVYHCLTVITVNIQTTVPNLQKRIDKTGFAFKLCLNGAYPPKPENIQAEFSVKVKITHPNATLTDADPSNNYIEYVETLDKIKNPNGCQEIKVTTSENGDYDQEIQFDITANLLHDPTLSREFNSSRPTVSAHSDLASRLSVRAAECAKEPCEPILTVKLSTSANSPYLIGSSKTESIFVSVANGAADTAYRPCVRVRALGATVRSAPTQCTYEGDSQRICQLQRALKANNTWEVTELQSIELGLASLTSKSEQIQVIAEVFNRCETSKKPDHQQPITIELTTDASGLKLESKTDQGEIVPFNKHDIIQGKKLHHTYTITNTGEINWVDIYCDIWLYKSPYIAYNESIQIYSGDTARKPCGLNEHTNSSSDSSDFKGLNCSLGNLFRKETITVVIPINVVAGALEEVLQKANGTVKTLLRVHAEHHEREREEHSILVLQEATVPVWVIVSATAVGIIIVILIAYALRECGLLRRKKKEQLENLQKEVKRKSMMLQRQSMRLPPSARAELSKLTYRELLDAAEIKEAEEAEEARESSIGDKRINIEDNSKRDNEGCATTALNGNSSVSNLDLKSAIEKSLQKQNPKGHSSKSDKMPLCNESEI